MSIYIEQNICIARFLTFNIFLGFSLLIIFWEFLLLYIVFMDFIQFYKNEFKLARSGEK